ncbi:uncharacterized protein LOC110844259 [Folsomia candida]|uniref:uncharacterized protein LOC110844259 n=1 Tax=Folsomia candida TaxID=158441 RepID=UPI000B8F4013|nr:uncharacterized protein LOC110844259 [Folsomia candida]
MKMRWSSMALTGLWIFSITFLFGLVCSVKITELRVPQNVLNGTHEPVILDCDFTLEEDEHKTGVVVKWFFNRGPSYVYQWIYGQKPVGLGILRNRLDLDYVASDEDWNRHRALKITNPTTELTGDWLCRVSTFKLDAMKTAKMIVFAPQKVHDIALVSRPTADSINISCWATGAYPEPKLTITYGNYELPDVRTDSLWSEGAYNVAVHTEIKDSDLSAPLPVIFDCELKIPNTSYIHRKNLLYAGPIKETETSAAGSKMMMTVGTFFYTNLLIAWAIFRWT